MIKAGREKNARKLHFYNFASSTRRSMKIYKRDIHTICTNWVTLLIIIVLIFIPSLYAWFNIRACWDPYGNTKALSVAVVNLDKGAEYRDNKVTAGKDIVKKLKGNDKIGWTFVSKSEAAEGVKYGKYYASITIPEDFSKNLLSIVTDAVPKKAKLIYSVNEKKNAIAEKITDKGSSTLQQEITTTFIETVTEDVMSYLNQFGLELQQYKPDLKNLVDTIIDLDSKMPEIGSNINNAYDGAVVLRQYIQSIEANTPVIADTLNKTLNIAKSNQQNMKQIQNSLNTVAAALKADQAVIDGSSDRIKNILNGAQNISSLDLSNLNNVLGAMKTSTDNSIMKLDNVINNLKTIEQDLKNNPNPNADALNAINNTIQNSTNTTVKNIVGNNIQNIINNSNGVNTNTINSIDTLINNLTTAKNNLQDQEASINTMMTTVNNNINKLQNSLPNDVKAAINNANQVSSSLDSMINDFNNNTIPAINNALSSCISISNNTITLLQSAQNNLPLINSLLSMSEYGANSSVNALKDAKDRFPQIQQSVHSTAEKLKKLDDSKRYDEIVNLLLKNAQDASDFLSNPVDLQENRIYAIPNYGSAMSPFYTTLAIWVGTFVVMSLLSVDVKTFQDGEVFSKREEFFGRYFTICSIAILQALVVTVGDIVLLKTYVVSPIVYVFFGMYVAIVFSMIIYMFVSVLGNIGKAITMIALVLQVSASGGTYPIELTPPFFQYINPLMPFRYSIGGMREAVAGIIYSSLAMNAIALFIFFVVALSIGVIFKPKANELLERFVKQFKESGLAGE